MLKKLYNSRQKLINLFNDSAILDLKLFINQNGKKQQE